MGWFSPFARTLARTLLFSALGSGLFACSTPNSSDSDPSEKAVTQSQLSELSLQDIYTEKTEAIGCKGMLDSYCKYLYSPIAQGNMKVGRGPDSLLVLQGRTSNDFTSVYYAYAQAKLHAQGILPNDFRDALASHDYFGKLSQYLGRRPREEMSLRSRVQSLRTDSELDGVWNSSIAETVLRRIEKKFPGYHRLKDDLVPLEIQVERRRVQRELISEVSRSIWKQDRNWRKVEDSFDLLKKSYVSMIQRLDIPEPLRKRWLDRLTSVKLVIPGALPEISDTECSTTQVNAFYYTHLNVLTVCAGDFNSEDILQTVAHELGHALDLERSRYIFEKESSFGTSLASLRQSVCAPARPLDCAVWSGFKDKFKTRLADLNGYQPELPDFNRCLKRRPTSNTLDADDVDRIASQVVSAQVATLADSNLFLRITKDEIPLPNGKLGKNPNYLNPCSYYLWSLGEEPIDDELTQLLFFTAEYQCSEGSPAEKLKNGITVSKTMATEITKKALVMEGEFSTRSELETEGIASASNERFADVLGSYALADALKTQNSLWTRRETFLASSSWQCTKPSLASLYPEESSVQQAFALDSHSEGDDRKKEFFSAPVREVIGCEKDFHFDECRLPFKK